MPVPRRPQEPATGGLQSSASRRKTTQAEAHTGQGRAGEDRAQGRVCKVTAMRSQEISVCTGFRSCCPIEGSV
eukprot:12895363-Prorocentrum_lima.AAC.1